MPARSSQVLRGEDLPAALRALSKPPRELHVVGRLPPEAAPKVAIVGSRTPSPSGAWAAYRIAHEAARAGVVVVSGLARGIDAAAHRGAVDAGGYTVAFLGNGTDVVYPRSCRELSKAIEDRGALVSEYPPGTEPRPWRFVQRNRLVAGYARGTVVVEAGDRSGALITAGLTLEMGKELWAVPGDPRRPGCRGSNRLIRDGVGVVLDGADLLLALGLAGVASGDAEPEAPPGLGTAEAGVWRALQRAGGLNLEGLALETRLPVADLLEALSLLEIAGRIRRDGEGFSLDHKRR